MFRLFGMAAAAGILTLPVSAQIGSTFGVIQRYGGPLAVQFALQADPPSAMGRFRSGSSIHSSLTEVIAHRYFYNEFDQVYFGYDARLEIDPQNGPVRITFYDLSIGVLDFVPGPGRGDPAAWKKLPLPALPSQQSVRAGDRIAVELWSDSIAGQKLADLVRIEQPRPLLSGPVGSMLGPSGPSSRYSAAAIPTVSGDAHPFSAEDAELRLVQPRVTIDGEVQPALGRTANASGTLVWFHLPGRGRYVLSLAPRPELGFVKAGEVRGGAITFTIGNDRFLVESTTAMASGDAPYILYVLHDPDWEPTSKNQGDRLQFGSVAPRELALLQKK